MSDDEWPLGQFREMAGKVFGRCSGCGKIIRVDKPIFGSLHICRDDT